MVVPCGLGGVLTPRVISELASPSVVGAANNQLAQRDGADALRERGILWAPDFVVNAGGVIYLDMASEPDADAAKIEARVSHIGETVTRIIRDAEAQGITTLDAAERLAEERLGLAVQPA